MGSLMLQEYLKQIKEKGKEVKEIRLLCKENLKGFYGAAGFMLVGPSPVVHGQDTWFEMVCKL